MPYYIKRSTKAKSDNARLIAKLDRIFSLYIRLRDSAPFHHQAFRCISCGQVKPFEQADCGHFFSRRHMATRFDEDNCWCECRSCNRFSADHLHAYESNLKSKIGEERFSLLEWRAHQTKKWHPFELQQLIAHYTEEVRKMTENK